MEEKKLVDTEILEWCKRIRKQRPIVHCITNIVTVNDCANILLAVGASPTMAHHPLEVEEITSGCTSLVCNMGALDDYEAMINAGERAAELHHPIVIDPVGVGGSSYRRNCCLELIAAIHPTCIRGNYSEIRALITEKNTIAGVDADPSEQRKDGANDEELFEQMQDYAKRHQTIVIASGATDLITDGHTAVRCGRGTPMMARITGSGCMSTAMLGAFLGIESSIQSACACVNGMGIAGEVAEQRMKRQEGGTMTFRNELINAVYFMSCEQ